MKGLTLAQARALGLKEVRRDFWVEGERLVLENTGCVTYWPSGITGSRAPKLLPESHWGNDAKWLPYGRANG